MKAKYLQILFLFFTIIVYGQVTIVGLTDEKEFRQNKKFTLTFIIQINGNDWVQESPIKLPDFSKFDELGSASDQNTIIDQKSGTNINQIIYQYVLQPKQTGKIKIGSALVQVNGKMYKSESFDVFVKEADKKSTENNNISKNQNEVFLNVEIKNKEVLQYQSTVAVLRIISKDFDQFRKVSQPQITPNSSLDISTIDTTPSEIEPSSEFPNFLSQTIAVYSITPNESGKIEIPNATAVYRNNGANQKIYSNKNKLLVKAIPQNSPYNFKNAIGNFEVSLTKKDSLTYQEIGKPIDVYLKISGKGNLQKLALPELYPSTDYTFYKPQIFKNYIAVDNDYQGEIIAHYIVVPKKAGEISIKTNHFSYYNDDKKQFVELGAILLPLNILTQSQFESTKSTIEKVNNYTNSILEKVETPILKTTELKIKEKSSINWKFVLGNLALVFAVLYGALLYSKYRKTKRRESIQIKKNRKPIGSVAETEAELRNKKMLDFESHYKYLQFLAEENNSASFFLAYQDFLTEVENEVFHKKQISLDKFLKEKGLNDVLGNILALKEKINIEKYNPNRNSESLKVLSVEIKNEFQIIQKELG